MTTLLEEIVAKAIHAAMAEDYQKTQIPMIKQVMAEHGQIGRRIPEDFLRPLIPWEQLTDADKDTYYVMAKAAIPLVRDAILIRGADMANTTITDKYGARITVEDVSQHFTRVVIANGVAEQQSVVITPSQTYRLSRILLTLAEQKDGIPTMELKKP
jgi:hypothetical protein